MMDSTRRRPHHLATLLVLLACCPQGPCVAVEQDRHVDSTTPDERVDNSALLGGSLASKYGSTSCYEEDERYFPIIDRQVWDGGKASIGVHAPVEYVVVRDGPGGSRCSTHADCVQAVRAARHADASPGRPCELLENFYVGDDGHVYEGRGWDVAPYWHLNGLRRESVTVQFLGPHDSEGPTEKAVDAFIRMVKMGVWLGKVSADHRVVSLGQVYNDSGLVGDALQGALASWKTWKKDLDPLSTWEIYSPRMLPLIVREVWAAAKSTLMKQKLAIPIEYVMLLEGGERCSSREDCTTLIRKEQRSLSLRYGDLFDNFYVGEDGNVYEGRGFDSLPVWHVRGMRSRYITVRIFGNFKEDHPSVEAITALKLLLNTGVWLGKISPKYKLYSLRGIYGEERFLGDGLLRHAQKWSPWAHHVDEMSLQERERLGFLPLLTRKDWNAKEDNATSEGIEHPVDYVMIMVQPNSRRCFEWSNCTALIKRLQAEVGLKENFYIGDDGNIYEGLGWDVEPQLQIKYFNQSYLSIRFLGGFRNESPCLPAIYAFESLIRLGVNLGKISRDYKLYSFRHIYHAGNFMGKKVDEYFKKYERWDTTLDEIPEEERLSLGLLPIVVRNDWVAQKPRKTFHQLNDNIKYVIVGDTGGEHCLTTMDCLSAMQSEQAGGIEIYGDIADNFYIGGDGIAYEGRGWSNASSWFVPGVNEEFIYVSFFGQYEESPPTAMAVLALFRLMEHGVKIGKLARNFKVTTMNQIFDNRTSGSFHEDIQYWQYWTEDLRFFFDVEKTPSGLLFVCREDWEAEDPEHILDIPEFPLKYIIIHDTGRHCEDLAGCISSVKELQENITFRHWDIEDNFYLGDDGHIYEGRGDASSFWYTKGIENKFISVGFLGSFQTKAPDRKALDAFRFLTIMQIRLGKLVPNFKILSLSHVFDDESMVGAKLIEELKKNEHWSDVTTLSYDRARLSSWRQPIVLHEEWQPSEAKIRRVNRLQHPSKYVLVRDGGESCDAYEACVELMRREHDSGADNETSGLKENFYVGGDGFVYEGIGWDWDMLWTVDDWESSVSVQFFGIYDNELPTTEAIDAFRSVVLKVGVETGKLAPDYKVLVMPEKIGASVGKRLKNEVPSWNQRD